MEKKVNYGFISIQFLIIKWRRIKLNKIKLNKELWVEKIIPAIIFFCLWLNGWFYPLLLLPILYIFLVEKKNFEWLGFRKEEFKPSILYGLIAFVSAIAIYFPIFLYYLPIFEGKTLTIYNNFTDIIWYPLYEEISYRSWLFVHYADFDNSYRSKRNNTLNILQSILFVFIHWQYIMSGTYLILVVLFIFALLNGFLFLYTRNIVGCILSHVALNGFAILSLYCFVLWIFLLNLFDKIFSHGKKNIQHNKMFVPYAFIAMWDILGIQYKSPFFF